MSTEGGKTIHDRVWEIVFDPSKAAYYKEYV